MKYSAIDKNSCETQPEYVYKDMQNTINDIKRKKATLTELASRLPQDNFEQMRKAF